MANRIDFTNCKRIVGRAYNGANGKKIAIEYENERYMLKFPPSGNRKTTELSYTNSSVSEHIASSIFNMIGIKAQKTILGTFTVNGKEKIVCACKDFTGKDKNLYDFCSIKNTVIDSEHNGTGTELSDVLETIEKQQFVNPTVLLTHFWDVFVADALLGNFDRHNGNWGFLFDDQTQTTEIAPVFDCGSCLLPQADENVMKAILENEDELNARIFQFPTSAIKINDRKINYYDFLSSMNNRECNKAILRIVPNIDIELINAFIDSIIYISDIQKEFYKTYIKARYEKILLPNYRALSLNFK
ncbi:MAG: HipA domain-containing protein [Clostridia bacterium]|nr:HipA domain-containing protein [Clostridia bacterium]MBQ9940024.1 HipA domain-containing protein [Clostridia bacterium]